MKRTVWKLGLVAISAGAFLTGCDPTGDYCDFCSADFDCQPGLTCQEFRSDDGKRYKLCADKNPNGVCKVTEYN